MMDILRDQRSSLMAKHASIITLVAAAVAAVGVLMGLGAADLYETANSWILLA
jgi:hypothetical protein